VKSVDRHAYKQQSRLAAASCGFACSAGHHFTFRQLSAIPRSVLAYIYTLFRQLAAQKLNEYKKTKRLQHTANYRQLLQFRPLCTK